MSKCVRPPTTLYKRVRLHSAIRLLSAKVRSIPSRYALQQVVLSPGAVSPLISKHNRSHVQPSSTPTLAESRLITIQPSSANPTCVPLTQVRPVVFGVHGNQARNNSGYILENLCAKHNPCSPCRCACTHMFWGKTRTRIGIIFAAGKRVTLPKKKRTGLVCWHLEPSCDS